MCSKHSKPRAIFAAGVRTHLCRARDDDVLALEDVERAENQEASGLRCGHVPRTPALTKTRGVTVITCSTQARV